MAQACDGSRTPDRRDPDGGAPRRAGRRSRARPHLAALGLAALVAAVLGGCGADVPAGSVADTGPGTARGGSAVTAETARSDAALTLLAQSSYVGPGQAFTARLAIGSSVPAGASVDITVYERLTSRSAFVQTLGGTVSGSTIAASQPIALSSLPSDPAGGVDLTVPVLAGSGVSPPSTGAFTADLHCAVGECGGVYPLRLQLDTSVGGTRPQLLTDLVYEEPPANTSRLRVALVTPLSLPADPASATGAVAPAAAAALGTLGTLAAAFATHPDVATTVVPSPSTLASLGDETGPRARQLLSQLQALAADGTRQTLAGPYAAVDPAELVGAGLDGELADQVQRGTQALAAANVHAAGGTWVDPAQLDQTTVGQLAGLGFDHVVLPATSLAGTLFRLTPSAPVTVPGGRTTAVTAALEDPILDQQLADSSVAGANAVLAANQVLADLALVYYEEPNLAAARAVVALSPTLWSPDPAFVDTLLAGLGSNPVLQPVTLGTLFDTVPAVPGGALRRSGPDPSTLPVRAVRSTRDEIAAFATAVSDPSVPRGLSDLLLAAESDLLRPARQAAGVAGAAAALHTELGRVSINPDSIRLTSSAANVPVTIVKTASYTVTAVMATTSDKLLLPQGGTRTVVLDRPTNAVYVDMQARAGGVFRVTVTLTSPRGGLVIASRQLTVRSMSTSAVAIALSLGAVAVLLVWWGRTVWRRSGGRGAHSRSRRARRAAGEPGDDQGPAGDDGTTAAAEVRH